MCVKSLLEGISQSLWLMSGILSQLKQAGFNPLDPSLFNTNISFISASLSSQVRSAAALADFLQSKRRESYVAHATLPLSQVQKRELLVSPGSTSCLFDQSLLEKISSQVTKDSFISSSLSMAKIAQSCTFRGGKSSSSSSVSSGSASQAGPSGYQSPLFQRSASNKRSTSPGRGGGSKRFKGGRGRAPASKPRQGFRKQELYPCPTLTGGCLSLHWQAWRDRSADPWVVEVLLFGYRILFLQVPPLSKEPIPMASYSPTSTKGIALEEVTLSLVEKGAVELAPLPSPGFYSRMFVVWKTSGSWRPVIDLSVFNRFVLKTPFKMETIQSVLLSVRQGDWMVSIDLKEAYLQVPAVCGLRQALPVSGSLLLPLHGS